jgi:hypothetical protein
VAVVWWVPPPPLGGKAVSEQNQELRKQVVREKAKYDNGKVNGRLATNRAEREMSAAFCAAYTSVLWMMDNLERKGK